MPRLIVVTNEAHGQASRLSALLRDSPARSRVRPTLDEYADLMGEGETDGADWQAHRAVAVNHFYDLVTDFYEYGWGPSFHFATRFTGETKREATARFEHALALRLGLKPGLCALDIGCGIGGPMRTIARFSGASILGINNNDYQVARAARLTRAAKLEGLCTVRKGDFMALDLPPDSMDCAYAIEATCHAPSLEEVYAGVRRVLKPGGLFACIEWCTTAGFGPENPEHRRLCDAVIAGNGLAGIPSMDEAVVAARRAGLEVLETADLSLTGDIPWYEPLAPEDWSFASLRSSRIGRRCTNMAVGTLEMLRIAPRGARAVSRFLNEAAEALVKIGRAGIFTPDFLIMMRKPLERAEG